MTARLTAVLLIMVLLLPTLAVKAQDNTIYAIASADADVRVGPDFAYPVIGRLPRNASVVVLGRAGDFYTSWDGRQWFQIEYGTGTAWVYARLLRTSKAFNSIPPTGMILPRDANGRVPDTFDLTTSVCDQWVGGYAQSGNFMAGDVVMTMNYPGLTGANMYSVIVISPTGYRTAFDSETTTATVELENLPWEAGTYTWRIAPYWANGSYRYSWQQVCLLRTGGTFDKPDTTPQPEQDEAAP